MSEEALKKAKELKTVMQRHRAIRKLRREVNLKIAVAEMKLDELKLTEDLTYIQHLNDEARFLDPTSETEN